MKPQFQDLNLECWWETTARLGPREPCVCLYLSNPDACLPLLGAIEELQSEDAPAKRTITFSAHRRTSRISKLRLLSAPKSDELRYLCVSVDKETTTVEMTTMGLDGLRQAIENWRDGAEDFCIPVTTSRRERRNLGEKDLASGELWFWGPYYQGP